MRIKSGLRDCVFVGGFACVVSAAFLVALPLGLVTLGGPLMLLAMWEPSKKKGSGA